MRVVDQKDQDFSGPNWCCFCEHVWKGSNFNDASWVKSEGQGSEKMISASGDS